jgi:hypothetical protein
MLAPVDRRILYIVKGKFFNAVKCSTVAMQQSQEGSYVAW